jgi:DNA helicase II / ATP-dependent DNA helicase PcrA
MNEIDILATLNEKQKEAVLQTNGPLLVIAGAGSGKTRALTHRIAYMINEKKISPWNILAVTFTNKAANEMKQRVVKLLKAEENDAEVPSIGTFHATCVRILRKNIQYLNYDNSFNIYDTADQEILIKHVMEDLGIDDKQLKPRAVLHHISGAKNQLITSEKYRYLVHNYFTEQVAKIYEKYQKALQKNNALDFDDIIMMTVQLFQQESKVLDFYQEKFKFISIDEYQDTNQAQYLLTNLLAQKYRNICVIGDTDQSIYSFRGANITNILSFEKDYPEAKVVLLEQNYRSTQPILDTAHSIITKNTKRKEKKLWTKREGGEKITVESLENERAEAEFVCRKITENIKEHEVANYRDFVVLYRTNAQSRVMEEACLRYGLPYKIIGGIRFYQRKEIKDIIAYLRVIQNPADSVCMLRIINTPTRKIGTKTIEVLQQHALQNGQTLFQAMDEAEKVQGINATKAESIKKFVTLIKDFQKINREFSAAGVIKHVIDYSGYKKFIDDGTVEGEARLENIYELISVANKYDNLEAGLSLNIFLEEVALISDIDELETTDNAITLMTIHSAKGLEFPNVFIIGLEEGILPHSRSLLEQDELEEERRLMYVAVTRAKDKLYLLHARSRMLYGETQTNTPSQFLEDIPHELLDAKIERQARPIKKGDLSYTPVPYEEYDEPGIALYNGDKVFHQTFGEGTVVSITGGVATVAFNNPKHGIKKLALSIAPLKKVEG